VSGVDQLKSPITRRNPSSAAKRVSGHCICGVVEIEINFPAWWAWHDHGKPSRLAHGAAYVTYIGCWRKHVRFTKGTRKIARYEDTMTKTTRSFCSRCGTPLLYEKEHSPHMVNIPRALFADRTGREPRYHLNFGERQDWTWAGETLAPLKGFPDVVWERPSTKKRIKPREFE